MRPKDPPNWEDAKVAIQEFGGWVKNADTKSTILSAAVGLVFVALLTRVQRLGDVVRMDSAWRCPLILIGILLLASMVFLAICLFSALRARKVAGHFSRFSWPSVAGVEGELKLNPDGSADEAWIQARALASIVRRKYYWFNRALATFWVTLVLFAVLVATLEIPKH
jgi:hypothetical protein